ncbi:hypothetical protein [Hymenobacter canadensis]|uniref:YARHG domain-containing protein n=1 Tax=Hymenobacter canadensis TaxID=2999067 RepID=A0ABY7LPQ4_9BACT|nr:hypothetical protein [Hymenobacter canadensis]WBA41422.1 hypothetical protein O3303_16590 [Hymenobacter canadensis]
MTKCLFALAFCFVHYEGFSQVTGNPEDASALSIRVLENENTSHFKAHPNLYNGPEYIDYSRKYFLKTGHQFFISDSPQRGTVFYNGRHFPDVNLWYDLVLDQVVLLHPSTSYTPRLVDEHVQSFLIDGRRFLRLVADSATGKAIQTGYYQVLIDSNIQVVAKRVKLISERLEQGNKNADFYSKDRYFLRKNNLYYPIDSKASIVKHMADHEKEIQKFIKANRLGFSKKTRELDIIELADYYNSLSTE